MEWLFNNPNKANEASSSATPKSAVRNEAFESLKGMSFSEKQATAALLVNSNAVDKAVEWLFGQGEGLDAAVDKILAVAMNLPI